MDTAKFDKVHHRILISAVVVFCFCLFYVGRNTLYLQVSLPVALWGLMTMSPLLLLFAIFALISGRLLLASTLSSLIYCPVDYIMTINSAAISALDLRKDDVDIFVGGQITSNGILYHVKIYLIYMITLVLASLLVSKLGRRIIKWKTNARES